MKKNNFYIFTGGPGSGKTTTINQLKHMGYITIGEVARDIIQKQVRMGGDALPWKNTVRYANLMLLRSIVDFEELSSVHQPCFFDRGILDTLGYAHLIHLPLTDKMLDAAYQYRYNSKVFVFPYWEEIYIQDTERKQSREEAQQTCVILKETYKNLGYRTVDVPFLSPRERAEWILQQTELR